LISTGCRQPGQGHSPLNRSSSRRSATPQQGFEHEVLPKIPLPAGQYLPQNGFKLREPFLVLFRPVFDQELGGW